MPCKVFDPNRTKMFHVKHFGTIQIAGNAPRLVCLRGHFRSRTSLSLAHFAKKRGERGAGFLRLQRSGK